MKIHFIGIGGIGVSALARYYLKKGHKVSGSDLVASEIIAALKKKGAKIFIGKHKAKNISKNTELVVYSPAVLITNPEVKEAKKRKIKIASYPQSLGELTKEYFTIAVTGSHGKSTVAAMIALLLRKASLDPTVIIGTNLKELGNSNCRVGKSKYLVIEADEHFASFLNYWPKIIVLTTIESDHLDYYKSFSNLLRSFKKFVSHLPKDGFLVVNKDDKNIVSKFSKIVKNVKWYSLRQKESRKLKKLLQVPGQFNISNALAALTVAKILKIPDKVSFQSLSQYKYSWRRFEVIKMKKPKPFTLIHDYGHHPTQLEVTLKAAREKFPKRKIWCVFQPHQYQRTYYLFDQFVKSLKKSPIDKIIVTDIYTVAGREKKSVIKKVNSQKLVKAVNKSSVIYIPQKRVCHFLMKNIEGREVVVIMGAGDIYSQFKGFFNTKVVKR